MNESNIQKLVRLKLSQCGYTMFRQQVGTFYAGDAEFSSVCKTVIIYPGDAVVRHCRVVKVGEPGMSDLIGWRPINGIAQYCACETKAVKGRLREDQKNFLAAVNAAGGHGFVAKGPEDVP